MFFYIIDGPLLPKTLARICSANDVRQFGFGAGITMADNNSHSTLTALRSIGSMAKIELADLLSNKTKKKP